MATDANPGRVLPMPVSKLVVTTFVTRFIDLASPINTVTFEACDSIERSGKAISAGLS